MSAVECDSPQSDRHGQELLDDVVRLFTNLLIASGATKTMIEEATKQAILGANGAVNTAKFTELGALQRDCMEVMCMWRRDVSFVGSDGEPMPLDVLGESRSFGNLCSKVSCKNPVERILAVLLDFGAVSIRDDGKIVSETPTFLLGRAAAGGRLATDGLLKQLEGFLKVVHGNICSVTGHGKAKFERACTVAVAAELEPIFDRLVRVRGQEFIDSIDEWLERNSKFESARGEYVELGAGAYAIALADRTELASSI